MDIHWTAEGPVYLEEWDVTWTMRAGEESRTWSLRLPAASEEGALDAAHALAYVIDESSAGVWQGPDEVTVTRAGHPGPDVDA